MKKIVIDGVEYTQVNNSSDLVLVRTYSAGVHFGELVKRDRKEVELKNAQRIWRWQGANTLNEIAEKGLPKNDYNRISEPVSSIILTEAIEVMSISEEAAKTLGAVWN